LKKAAAEKAAKARMYIYPMRIILTNFDVRRPNDRTAKARGKKETQGEQQL
jgi:hypothetical protein